MGFVLLGILNAQAGGGADPLFTNLQAASVPSYGEIGASGGTGASSYYFAFYPSYTNGWQVSDDANSWTSLSGFPSFLQNKSMSYAGYPSHANVSGDDCYGFQVNDDGVEGHWLVWYQADPTFPTSATLRLTNITYNVNNPFYGGRTYSWNGTIVGSVWGFQSTLNYARLSSSTSGSSGSGSINNPNGGWPSYDAYGNHTRHGTMNFSWSGSGSDYYLNEIYGGSTSSNPVVTSQLVTMPVWNTTQPFYLRLNDGTKLLSHVSLTDQEGYIYSGGVKPSDGFNPSTNTVWRNPTQLGNSGRPIVLPDSQTVLFVEAGGEEVYLTTDLQTYTLYAGEPNSATTDSQVAVINRTGSDNIYLLWGSSGNEVTANDVL